MDFFGLSPSYYTNMLRKVVFDKTINLKLVITCVKCSLQCWGIQSGLYGTVPYLISTWFLQNKPPRKKWSFFHVVMNWIYSQSFTKVQGADEKLGQTPQTHLKQ